MDHDAEFPSLFPLETSLKDVYPAALKCALLTESLERRAQELSSFPSNNYEHSPTGCSPKYIDKLQEAVINRLKRQLRDTYKHPHIAKLRQTDQDLWDILMHLLTHLDSIPKDLVSQRIGNIEALVMIFSKYATQSQSATNKNTSVLSKGAELAEKLKKFSGLLRCILEDEFKAHPAYSVILHRLNQCDRSQDDGSSIIKCGLSSALHLQKLFSFPDQEHLKLVAGYKPICNGHSSFQDLKKCLTHLEKQSAPYFTREEFLTADAFNGYKDKERASMSQLIASMSLKDPDLVSLSTESSAFSPHDYREKPFVFIPKDSRSVYRALLMVSTQKELVEKPGATALSDKSLLLLGECALRWRLQPNFKLTANLEAIAFFFGRGALDFDILAENFFQIQQCIEEHPCESWAASDRHYLAAVFSYLLQVFLDAFCDNLEDLTQFPVALGHVFLDTVDYLFESFVLKELGVERAAFTEELAAKLQGIFIQRYEQLNTTAAPEAGASEALNLHLMTRLIMKDIRYASQLFRAPLLGSINATEILIGFELKYFTLQAENMLNGRESDLIPVEDALNFYNGVVELYDLARKHLPGLEVGINLVHWFNRQFNKWLTALDGKSLGWVELAIKYDDFQSVSGSSLHSSSVDDLIRGFREQLDFLDKLSWPNDLLESRSMARVAKVIYQSIELYTERLVDSFNNINRPPSSSSPKPKWEPKWDVLKVGPKKEEGVPDISQKQCVFINNIYHLRKRTQEMFQNIDYQRYSSVLAEYIKDKHDDVPQARMFYIKVVSAESLRECDSDKDNDAYAVLRLGDKDLLTTSVQWDNPQPKWNETCGVALDCAQDITVRIFDKDLLTDDLCGEGILYLDPQDDWSNEDAEFWLELEPQGRVLFSISTADEKDDPQYYIAKAIRILEMAEIDLIQSLRSKFTSAIKASLSRKGILRDLHKRRDSGFFKFFGNSVASEPQVSDEDCDRALVALVDVIDSRLSLPFRTLCDPCGYRLVTSIWRECLLAIENAMIPPFSEKRATPKLLTKLDLDFLMRVVEIFFRGGEDADGLPAQMLEIPGYLLLHTMHGLYFSPTDNLIREYMHVYKNSDTTRLRERSPTMYKADVILRLIRMKGDEHGLHFVESQLAMRSKSLEWAHAKKKSPRRKLLAAAKRVSLYLKP